MSASGACPSAALRNTWRNDGSASAACRPIIELSTGTSRQPEHLQPLAGGDLLDPGHRGRLLLGVLREEGDAGRVRAGGREVEVDDGPEEAVRHLDEDAGAVADVGLGVGGPAVVEVAEGRPARARPSDASVARAGRRRRRRRRHRARSAGRRGLAWWAASAVVHPGSGGSKRAGPELCGGTTLARCRSYDSTDPRAEAANRYHHRQRAGVGGQVVSGGSNAEMADVTEAYGAARELLDRAEEDAARHPRRRRPLSPAARAGGRAARGQGPSPARRGRAEGRGHRPDPCPRRRSSTSTIRPDPDARRPGGRRLAAPRPTGSPTGLDRMLKSAISRAFEGSLHLRPLRSSLVWPVSPARHYAGPTTTRRSLGEVAWLVP